MESDRSVVLYLPTSLRETKENKEERKAERMEGGEEEKKKDVLAFSSGLHACNFRPLSLRLVIPAAGSAKRQQVAESVPGEQLWDPVPGASSAPRKASFGHHPLLRRGRRLPRLTGEGGGGKSQLRKLPARGGQGGPGARGGSALSGPEPRLRLVLEFSTFLFLGKF